MIIVKSMTNSCRMNRALFYLIPNTSILAAKNCPSDTRLMRSENRKPTSSQSFTSALLF